MSTSVRLSKYISCRDLLGGRLERYGIRENTAATETADGPRCLSAGQYCIWVYSNDDGSVASLKRYGFNAVGRILQVIRDEFETDIITEHEAVRWGLATEKEWKAWLDEVDEQWEEEEYCKMQKYLRGEFDARFVGTNRAEVGEIARTLIAIDPTLALPEHKHILVDQVYSIQSDPLRQNVFAAENASVEPKGEDDSDEAEEEEGGKQDRKPNFIRCRQ